MERCVINADAGSRQFAHRPTRRCSKTAVMLERMLDPSAGSELALRDSKGQALHKQLPKAKTPHEQESLSRTIAATDNQIDALVYELYGLTEQESRIAEGEDKWQAVQPGKCPELPQGDGSRGVRK